MADPVDPASIDPAPAPSLAGGDPPVDPPVDPNAPPAPKPDEPPKPVDPYKPEDIKLPEGVTWASDAQQKEFIDTLNDPGLVKDGRVDAQRIFDLGAKALKEQADGNVKAWKDLNDKWVNEVKADPNVGDPAAGIKPEVKASIGKMIDSYGSPEVRQALDMTGAGNNPAIVRMLAKVAAKLTEGGSVQGSPVAKPAAKSLAETMWPSTSTETR